MGVIDRYGRDKNGNTTIDGKMPTARKEQKGENVDLDTLIKRGYSIGQNQQRPLDSVSKSDVSDGGYSANNRIDVIDPSKNEYVYRGKDYDYSSATLEKENKETSFFGKIRSWIKKRN